MKEPPKPLSDDETTLAHAFLVNFTLARVALGVACCIAAYLWGRHGLPGAIVGGCVIYGASLAQRAPPDDLRARIDESPPP